MGKRKEIKAHHYIISFDPEDATESGLTGEKAQALGLEYTRRNFPGHQALVCTHMDGHNESGNIHVHIVINSVRKFDVEPKDFMERRCDSRWFHFLFSMLQVLSTPAQDQQPYCWLIIRCFDQFIDGADIKIKFPHKLRFKSGHFQFHNYITA